MKQYKAHWETVFETKKPNEVSWTETYPKTSIDLILSFRLKKNTPIIDVGGGDSLLVDALLDLGFTDLTVLDISAKALQRAQERLGLRAKEIAWIESNILDFTPKKSYGLWHDRASFHFLTEEKDIKKYTTLVNHSKSESLVLGTFSTSGPQKCSGLVIKQYDCKSLAACFNESFNQIECVETDHTTPFNTTQKFVFSRLERRP